MREQMEVDVLIAGAGLAGLSLARQLLLAEPDLRILMVDRKREIPPPQQKVGEATVQMSGYYYSRVLEMEEHLLREHYLKYNLRFYWPAAQGNDRYEGYSQSYIRSLSNIATYQLDRNKFEAALLAVNQERPGFTLAAPVTGLAVDLAEEGPHTFRFRQDGREVEGRTPWVVDATGRGRFLARKLDLCRRSPIRHATSYLWVDGLLDIEKLTDLTPRQIRLRPDRSALGHLPTLLATNHYCGEGFWFWVIPLHGRTSLGLVYDVERIPREEVAGPDKLIDWVCRRFPLFAHDLPKRKVVAHGGHLDFAHDCGQTLSAAGWAMCGEACRFTDPLYSPGGDLISSYNTVIADAILTRDRKELAAKVPLYEALARGIYDAYVPSYAVSYDTLGDQECFSLRYVWELTVYFAYYVFPFVNDLFTDMAFLPAFLRRFARLGPFNRGLHSFLTGYYRWKRDNGYQPPAEPVFFDFMEVGALAAAEKCFYKVGLDPVEARAVLDEQLASLEELARWIVAWVAAAVLGDPRALTHPEFIRGTEFEGLTFDPAALAERLARCRPTAEVYRWAFPVPAPGRFGPTPRFVPEEPEEMAEEPQAEAAGGAR